MKRVKVEEEDRLDVFPALFGLRCMLVENALYSMASELSEDYKGGFWEFYRVGENGFYMAPNSGDKYHVVSPNGYECDMSADAFGLSVCLFTFSHLSFRKEITHTCSQLFHILREYVQNHEEAANIYQIID